MKSKKPRLNESQNNINLHDTIQNPKPSNEPQKKNKITLKKLQLSTIKKTLHSQQLHTSHRSTPPISSDHHRLSAIRYKSYDTTRYNKDYNLFEETDQTFYDDIKYVCEKNKNVLGNILSLTEKHRNQLTDTQCDQIDFIARKHYKANCINESYRTESNQKNNETDKCPCGCDKYRGKKIPFCTSLRQLKFLGSGALLIFMFLKTYAVLMALALIIYGVFAIATNLLGGQTPSSYICTDEWCRFINNSANHNKIEPHPLMVVQWWLGLAFSVIWLIATRVTKYNGRKMNVQIDRKLESASDRAVLIRNLPQGDFTEIELMQYFQKLSFKLSREKQLNENQDDKQSKNDTKKQTQLGSHQDNCNNFNVQNIQIIYSMEFARKINQRIIQLCKQINYVLQVKPNLQDKKKTHKIMKKRSEYHDMKQELIQFIEILGDLRNKFLYEENFRKSLSSQLCIVEFRSQKDKDQLLTYFGKQKVGFLTQIQENVKNFFLRKTQGSLRFKGNYLKIERAPQPSDIQWKKCEQSYSTRKTFGLYMLTIVIVGVSLGLVLALDRLQDFVDTQAKAGYFSKDSSLLTVINIASSIVLLIVNKFLWFSLAYMIEEEVNYTLSERIKSRMNKALFATSCNIILLPVITNWVFKVDVFSTKGMTGMVFDYQISTLFIGLPLKLFNPVEMVTRLALYVRFIRNWIIRYFCLELNMAEENQDNGIKVINKFYQGEYFDVAESFVYIMGTIYHSVFFCQIEPAVLITGTLIAIGFFFVLKAKLFYFCNAPEILDLSVFETALSQACLVPIIYGAGAISLSYIESQIDPSRPVQYHQAIICLGLAFLLFFNPGDVFNKLVMYGVDCFMKIKPNKTKEDKGKVQNLDTYFKNSNSLQLLGFEKVLKGASFDQTIQKELKRFCTQFIPKTKLRVQTNEDDEEGVQEEYKQKMGQQNH